MRPVGHAAAVGEERDVVAVIADGDGGEVDEKHREDEALDAGVSAAERSFARAQQTQVVVERLVAGGDQERDGEVTRRELIDVVGGGVAAGGSSGPGGRDHFPSSSSPSSTASVVLAFGVIV